MAIKDPRRRAVAERIRKFFAALKDQLAHGVEDIWQRVERKHSGAAGDKPTDAREAPDR